MFIGITIILGLIALAGGIALLIWAKRNNGKGVNLAKACGYILLLLAFFVIVITIFMRFSASSEMKNMTYEQHMNMMNR